MYEQLLFLAFGLYIWGIGRCCCAAAASISTQSCDGCTSGTPALCYELAVAGVTNDGCSEATEWNGTFTLGPVSGAPSACLWTAEAADGSTPCGTGCTASHVLAWTLQFGGGSLFLQAVRCNGAGPTYSTDPATYLLSSPDCDGNITLSLSTNGSDGADWPSTLTLVPVACP